MIKILEEDFRAKLASLRRNERTAVLDFARAVQNSDPVLCGSAVGAVDGLGQWTAAMRAIALLSPSDDFRNWFLGVWVQGGDHIRSEVNNDLILIAGLRALLPPYAGPSLTLFRGEGFLNRKRRTYGLSWSATAEVARIFAATGMYRTGVGGSVLLETIAPATAIVCAPAALNDRYGEQEFIVDRRRLGPVNVLEHFGHLSHDEFRQLKHRE